MPKLAGIQNRSVDHFFSFGNFPSALLCAEENYKDTGKTCQIRYN